MKELIQQDVEFFDVNPWRVKFIKYIVDNKSDLVKVNMFRNRLKIPAEENFEVGMAKYIYTKKIELGIIERKIDEISYSHALYVTKRMQSNTTKQFDLLQTYLLSIPTDEGTAFLKILLEKEKAFNKQISEEIKNGN